MMNFREEREIIEEHFLSKYAVKSINSKGRMFLEDKCEIRTDFQRDKDRIIHSKAFRRLKHKTQVFLSPEGDHYRTRLTHTLEVSQISRTISRALKLNEDLTEAIALGHDLGHTPFGHSGESELNNIHKPFGFKHNEQSLRIVDYLERKSNLYNGLNLTEEVRDGILNHNGETDPFTLEGQVVKISDRIAYINHDIDDAIRANVIKFKDLPSEAVNFLGEVQSTWVDKMIKDLIYNSYEIGKIGMSNEMFNIMNVLRDYMFENVYLNITAKSEENRAKHVIRALYYHFLENPDEMSKERYLDYKEGHSKEAVKDYISGMSDRYAINLYFEIFIPKGWK